MSCKHEDMSSVPTTYVKKLGMVPHSWNPGTRESVGCQWLPSIPSQPSIIGELKIKVAGAWGMTCEVDLFGLYMHTQDLMNTLPLPSPQHTQKLLLKLIFVTPLDVWNGKRKCDIVTLVNWLWEKSPKRDHPHLLEWMLEFLGKS